MLPSYKEEILFFNSSMVTFAVAFDIAGAFTAEGMRAREGGIAAAARPRRLLLLCVQLCVLCACSRPASALPLARAVLSSGLRARVVGTVEAVGAGRFGASLATSGKRMLVRFRPRSLSAVHLLAPFSGVRIFIPPDLLPTDRIYPRMQLQSATKPCFYARTSTYIRSYIHAHIPTHHAHTSR